ncbi:hypothetical protein MCEMSE18_00200 [Candidatus Planktophila versatilis]|uniref:hypothetical protein n=1 Tax=Candidatus Planktophila versatilis TaxID=1884905 RepID=UPI000BAC6AA8|nr:hypothetical protein [Candidatus Planktophila versatilis]ASY26002.1 hypothetical protein A1sIIB142_00925 [Candidatus Planktophila versatilis]
MKISRFTTLILSEKGNIESALVLIPLLTLFLVASQITITIHGRNMTKISAQDGASTRAISGNFDETDTFLHIDSPDPHQNLDLLISHKKGFLPHIMPGLEKFMGSKREIDVTGVAIVENQR